MAWLYVLVAAIVEVFWVIGLRYSDSALEWTGTVIAIIISFYAIIKACETLPSGTVYAVFTGSGAAAIFIAIIIVGVIGIKMTTFESDATVEGGD